MGIIWGMPTLIEQSGIEENIKLCKMLGLDFIQLNMNMPDYQPNDLDVEKLTFLMNKHNIFYTVHMPEELDIANFNDKIRKANIEVLCDVIELSKQLKIPIINMHMNMGIYFTLPTERIYLYEKYGSSYMKKINIFGDLVEKLLKGSNIKLSIENTGIYDIDYITKAVDNLIKKESIILTWDIGHDYSSGNKDEIYIRSNINKIKHMHIHDAIGEKNHLPAFSGEIDIKEKLEVGMINNSTCVLETKTIKGLKESIYNLQAKGVAIRRCSNNNIR